MLIFAQVLVNFDCFQLLGVVSSKVGHRTTVYVVMEGHVTPWKVINCLNLFIFLAVANPDIVPGCCSHTLVF